MPLLIGVGIVHTVLFLIHFRFSCRTSYYNPPSKNNYILLFYVVFNCQYLRQKTSPLASFHAGCDGNR